MPTWAPRVCQRARELAVAGKVSFTLKALGEPSAIDLDADDALDVLEHLTSRDADSRLRSQLTDEWMYVFKPQVGELLVYVKVIVRDDCIVVSFHEDEPSHDDPA